MMKKWIVLLLSLALSACVCAGCGPHGADEPDEPVEPVELDQPYNMALVATIANNNPVLDTGIPELSQLPALAGSTYSCILADSTPSVICDGTVPDFSNKKYTSVMLQRVQASIGADITARLNAAEPDSPDVDIAQATALAVREIRANEVEGRDNLLIYYSAGVSTSGLIDMTVVPVCELDVASSVEALTASLPLDMSGIRVIWYCCGDTAGDDQPALSQNEKSTLKDFYKALFMAMGAESVTFMDDVPLDGCYSFAQPVSVMKTEGISSALRAVVISYEDIASDESPDEAIEAVFAGGDILSFDPAAIAFQPDSTELADSGAAMDALAYVIDYMSSHPDFRLLICGTTTSAGEEAACIAFSEERAHTVKDLLVTDAGIAEERIYIVGCGWSSSLYVPDRTDQGTLDENICPQNRSVKLVDYDSETAVQILNSLNARQGGI